MVWSFALDKSARWNYLSHWMIGVSFKNYQIYLLHDVLGFSPKRLIPIRLQID